MNKPLWAFLAIAFGYSWSIEIGLRFAGVPFAIRVALAMFGPAIGAALVLGPLFKLGFATAGFAVRLPAQWRTYAVAYGAVPLSLAGGALAAMLLGVQHVDPAANLQALMVRYHVHAEPPKDPVTLLLAGLAASFTVAIPINMIFAFGEELGWRGFLLPQFAESFGERTATIAVGIIWGTWHLPLILLDGFDFPYAPWIAIPLTLAAFTAYSALFAPLRLRSNSIWPSTIAHAMINAQAGIVFVALAPAFTPLGAPLGLIGILFTAAVAVLIRRYRV